MNVSLNWIKLDWIIIVIIVIVIFFWMCTGLYDLWQTDAPNRQQTYTSKASIFLNHANKISDTAKLVAEAGASNDRPLIEELNSKAQEVKDLAPQVVAAGKVLLLNPGDQVSSAFGVLWRFPWWDDRFVEVPWKS